MSLSFTLLALSLLGGASLGSVRREAPAVAYVLRHVPAAEEGEDAAWVVEVRVAGSSRKRELSFQLSDWGSWAELGGYLEVLEADPPLANASPGTGFFEPRTARRRRDAVTLVYRVRLVKLSSEEQRRFGLLPTWSDDYAYGYSWNTLVQVLDGGAPLAGKRTIELVAPDGVPIVTGWAGRSDGAQTAELDAAMGNGPIAFGAPAEESRTEAGGFGVEVFQFGRGPDVTAVLAEVLHAAAPALGSALGLAPRNPYRAFVTDTQGGGMGSHFGLRIGVMEDAPEGHALSPWLRAHVTHELVHDWLGIALTERDPSLVWFKEGFTEYLSLWQAAASGLVSREWFANRLLELESIAREQASFGSVAFGDPEVAWRDGDGPNETLVYTGAPLLAFRIDAELRAAGRPGLLQLVRDLLAREPRTYDLADLRAWMEKHGLRERYRQSIAGTERPPVAETLALAGFRTVEEPADLTYFGLRTDGDQPETRVLAVDPRGPGARAGIRVGDVLTGWYCVRGETVSPRDGEVEYDFGLGTFEPGVEGTFLGVRRGSVDKKVFVEPEILEGQGVVRRRSYDSEELDAFFAFAPE